MPTTWWFGCYLLHLSVILFANIRCSFDWRSASNMAPLTRMHALATFCHMSTDRFVHTSFIITSWKTHGALQSISSIEMDLLQVLGSL